MSQRSCFAAVFATLSLAACGQDQGEAPKLREKLALAGARVENARFDAARAERKVEELRAKLAELTALTEQQRQDLSRLHVLSALAASAERLWDTIEALRETPEPVGPEAPDRVVSEGDVQSYFKSCKRLDQYR